MSGERKVVEHQGNSRRTAVERQESSSRTAVKHQDNSRRTAKEQQENGKIALDLGRVCEGGSGLLYREYLSNQARTARIRVEAAGHG